MFCVAEAKQKKQDDKQQEIDALKKEVERLNIEVQKANLIITDLQMKIGNKEAENSFLNVEKQILLSQLKQSKQ